MEAIHKKDVIVRDYSFERFEGAWLIPRDERRSGVILYLHGGGYTCGDLDYAKGFGATLADECGSAVFCAAYRLAPESPYPAAVEDALEAYRYLLEKGYTPEQIVLCGESAGGGLICALCLRLKELGMEMPAGLIGISPWTDLTCSGETYEENREADPSLTEELLQFYADCYTGGVTSKEKPLVSPLFGALEGLPPSAIFVGTHEVLLDDSTVMAERLREAGVKCELHVARGMWHVYPLYGVREARMAMRRIHAFIDEHTKDGPAHDAQQSEE